MAILHLSTKAEQDLPAAMTWEDVGLNNFFLNFSIRYWKRFSTVYTGIWNIPTVKILLAVALIFGIKKFGILKFEFQIFKWVLCDV